MERDENTAIAWQQSWDAGYRGFETDIRMTSDGVLYLTHDHTLERTTNGEGIFEQHTSAQIEKLRTKKGNRIMKLEEFCRFLDGKDSLYVEFELKTKPEELYPQARLEEYIEKVVALVNSIKTKGSLLVYTSSDYRPLRYLQTHYPEADLLLIISKPLDDETIAMAKLTGINTLGCTRPGTSAKMVQKAHEAGIIVSLWPNQSVNDIVQGIYLGADRLCCDVPVEVKTFLDEKMPWLKTVY